MVDDVAVITEDTRELASDVGDKAVQELQEQVRQLNDGLIALEQTPDPLQQRFVRKFEALQDWEQALIIAALERVDGPALLRLADAAGTGYHVQGSIGFGLPMLPFGIRADALWNEVPDETDGWLVPGPGGGSRVQAWARARPP